MAKETRDNPAWRLYDIIESGLRSQHGTVLEFWAAALRVPRNDAAEIFRGIATANRLLDETETLLTSADIDHGYFLTNLAKVRQGLTITSLDSAAGSVVNILQPIHREIGYWAHQIATTEFAIRLSDEELSNLTTELIGVLDNVREATSLDDDLRRVVLDGLEGLRRAILEYRMRGSASLQEEVERLSGRLGRHAEALKDHTSEEWFIRLIQVVSHVDSAAQKGKKVLPLLGKAISLLLPGDSGG